MFTVEQSRAKGSGFSAPSGLSGSGASAPSASKDTTGATEQSKASTNSLEKDSAAQPSSTTSGRSTTNDAVTKHTGSSAKSTDASLRDASYDWIVKPPGFRGTHCLVWPDSLDGISTPSLITGLSDLGADKFNEDIQEWRNAIGSGDLDKYRRFLKEADLPESDNHMERIGHADRIFWRHAYLEDIFLMRSSGAKFAKSDFPVSCFKGHGSISGCFDPNQKH